MTALRPYQQRAIADLRAVYASGRRSPVLVLPTGAGKCLGIGTPVLMNDGTIMRVEDVRPGDLLMGPDSSPRRVLSTTRGRSPLFRIVPVKGEPWICNDVHVLTLVHTETGDVVDIDLPSYLAESKWFRHLHKQFTPENGIDFAPAESLPLDPYFVGVWYGDGSKNLAGVAISKPDPEILAVCDEVATRFGLRVRTDGHPCPTHHIVGPMLGGASNPLLDLMRRIAGSGAHLPHRYLTASRSDRLAFLAGLLDTDGFMHRSGFEIVQKQRGFADGIAFLARSLGLRAIAAEKIVNGTSYWRVSISGNCSIVPTRIPRKRAPERKQIKCATRTGFSVQPIGEGEYAGFELDGDGRFLLGDFTVTHNTVVAAEIIRSATARGNRVLFLVHRAELLAQSVHKLESAGITNIRIIQAGGDLGTGPVCVASIPTLTRWTERQPAADLVIVDEAHHVVAKTWRRLADHYAASLILGLTATPQRADGKSLGDVFDSLVVGATVRELVDLGHLVPCHVYAPPRTLEAAELALSPVEAYRQHAGGDRAVVFCVTVEHAQRVAAEMNAAGIPTGVVSGAMAKDDRRRTLADLDAGMLRAVASCHVLTEGWDSPRVAVCILARKPQHTGLYLQMAGRVLRPAPGKTHATLIDLCGSVRDHGPPDLERDYALTGTGISKCDREAIRQCATCGGVFRAGPAACPLCGVTMPARPMAIPESLGIGVVSFADLPRLPPRAVTLAITAKHPGKCKRCGGYVPSGSSVYWLKGEGIWHAQCDAARAVSA